MFVCHMGNEAGRAGFMFVVLTVAYRLKRIEIRVRVFDIG